MANWNEFTWNENSLWGEAGVPPCPPLFPYLMSAEDHAKRLTPKQIKDDQDMIVIIKEIPGYAPSNKDFELSKLPPLEAALEASGQDEVKKEAAVATARDVSRAAEWAYHDFVLGARQAVKSQFGENSTQAQDVGFVRKSERAKPTRKAKPSTP